jgi:hypothetical protein
VELQPHGEQEGDRERSGCSCNLHAASVDSYHDLFIGKILSPSEELGAFGPEVRGQAGRITLSITLTVTRDHRRIATAHRAERRVGSLAGQA